MKIAIVLLAAWLTGCASLTALQASDPGAAAQATHSSRRLRAGQSVTTVAGSYPTVAVTPEGGHALVMPPCGNTAVVVNPDGSHSIAVINGMTATIVTP